MFYPSNLPITTVLETLHHDKVTGNSKRLRIFWILFGALFVWEWFPEVCFFAFRVIARLTGRY
jgi:hypothetical protein